MARVIILLAFGALYQLSQVSCATDYCKIECNDDDPPVHTMCKYKTSGPSSACGEVTRSGLSEAEREAIVERHNQLRQQVASGREKRGNPGPQPPAKEMPNLVWDEELAEIAQRWADQCTWEHDCPHVERFQVGQNLAQRSSSSDKVDLETMIQGWYDEVEHFDGSQVAAFNSEYEDKNKVGHYTQLVWAETTKIGCGFIVYRANGKFVHLLVCNYGEAGNYEDYPIYRKL